MTALPDNSQLIDGIKTLHYRRGGVILAERLNLPIFAPFYFVGPITANEQNIIVLRVTVAKQQTHLIVRICRLHTGYVDTGIEVTEIIAEDRENTFICSIN